MSSVLAQHETSSPLRRLPSEGLSRLRSNEEQPHVEYARKNFAELANGTPLLKALRNASMGSVLHVEELSPLPVQAVCVLQPYQDRLDGSDDLAIRINTFLTKAKYESDEGNFAFVFIGNDDITVERIKRSAKLDMFSKMEVIQAKAGSLPKNFTPEECVVGPSGVVAKIRYNERTYAVFGAMR
jgi:hypothetical protein